MRPSLAGSAERVKALKCPGGPPAAGLRLITPLWAYVQEKSAADVMKEQEAMLMAKYGGLKPKKKAGMLPKVRPVRVHLCPAACCLRSLGPHSCSSLSRFACRSGNTALGAAWLRPGLQRGTPWKRGPARRSRPVCDVLCWPSTLLAHARSSSHAFCCLLPYLCRTTSSSTRRTGP